MYILQLTLRKYLNNINADFKGKGEKSDKRIDILINH